ncbi:hemin uptake protein HemP [Fimbriiglobus ruber]|uniref:Hemin uptake protein HemP n=1 Tax=Fimbriiglobus ruber TaxID=1908690 RepID=A0A225D2I8_9BACT|nr:hemin uptake protein HemP [Fimbriiglobus ruber]OWK35801.1 hypothetical protein FRUB_08364 [Fimbriiglobus ruber]
MPEQEANPPAPEDNEKATPPQVYQLEEWLGGQKEVMIEYAGKRYRLRVTDRGRLILTK